MIRQRQGVRKGSDEDVLDKSVGSYEDFAGGIIRPEDGTSEIETAPDSDGNWMKMTVAMGRGLVYYATIALFAMLIAIALKVYFAQNNNISAVSDKQAKASSVPSSVLSTDSRDKSQWQEYLESRMGNLKVLSDGQIKYKDGKKLYLVVAGFVFDVTMGGKMYEKGSGYHGFIGQDGTRAFITGKFDQEGLVPDLNGLESDDLLGISKWIDFYLNHEKYKFVGLHHGTFFDGNGKPTQKMSKFQEDVMKAKAAKLVEEEKDKLYPSCNMEWSQASGSRLWCSAKSGGIDRDWVGWPRIFKEDGKEPRCACVRKEFLGDSRLELYKGCPADSIECSLKE